MIEVLVLGAVATTVAVSAANVTATLKDGGQKVELERTKAEDVPVTVKVTVATSAGKTAIITVK